MIDKCWVRDCTMASTYKATLVDGARPIYSCEGHSYVLRERWAQLGVELSFHLINMNEEVGPTCADTPPIPMPILELRDAAFAVIVEYDSRGTQSNREKAMERLRAAVLKV